MRALGFLSVSVLLLLFGLAQAQDVGPECGDSFTFDAPQDSLVTDVETDGFSGSISYTSQNGVEGIIMLDPPPVWGTVNGYTFPSVAAIAVIVNEDTTGLIEWAGGYYVGEGAASLSDLKDEVVKELRATRRDCYSYHPALGWIHMTSQWIVQAKLSEGQGRGGGGGITVQLATIEGFITQISGPEITIGKEGTFVSVIVINGTSITLNGKLVMIDNLIIGDKAKAKYDPSTMEAVKIKVER
jgi:hypothetical protein